jgi:hypothetical protein
MAIRQDAELGCDPVDQLSRNETAGLTSYSASHQAQCLNGRPRPDDCERDNETRPPFAQMWQKEALSLPIVPYERPDGRLR